METLCLNCGEVLTSASGERWESAYFDSSLPTRGLEPAITWARCEVCYKLAKFKLDKRIELQP
jgi:hypothetical protein